MNKYVFDIETDGLLYDLSTIHCIAAKNIDSGEEHLWVGSMSILAGLDMLADAQLLVGHNICGFDIPAIMKLFPGISLQGEILDTMLLSCILYPEEGTMSLESWAEKLRLSVEKVQHEDWSTYSTNMGLRCVNDVRINHEVLKHLLKNQHISMVKDALKLEQDVALMHSQQVENRVRFDIKAATDLYRELEREQDVLRKELVALAPAQIVIPGVPRSKQGSTREARILGLSEGLLPPYKEAFLKSNGQYNQFTTSYFHPQVLKTVKGPYTPISIQQFNPDSSSEVQEVLLSLGWKPTEYNTVKDKITGEYRTTTPKLTEDSFSSLPKGLGEKIGRYNVISHRKNFLQSERSPDRGAIPTAVKYYGDIPAEAFTCGTPTARYRHSGVVCNIPRPTTLYGGEIRALFTVPEGFVMVGADLSGIEARMLAHFLLAGNYRNAQETADLILSGDFHTVNAELWGVDRNTAKSILYATLYGAGPAKLAAIAGRAQSAGKKIKDDFYERHPAIHGLIQDLEIAFKRNGGWITGIDGRPLFVRRASTLLNTLLQNAATVVFKKWMVALEEVRAERRYREKVAQMIAYHDELQYRVVDDEQVITDWSFCCALVAGMVGIDMNLKVPIKAETRIGKTWRDTH